MLKPYGSLPREARQNLEQRLDWQDWLVGRYHRFNTAAMGTDSSSFCPKIAGHSVAKTGGGWLEISVPQFLSTRYIPTQATTVC